MRTDADTGGERTGNSKDGGVPEIKPILKSGSKEETTKVEKSTKPTLGEVGKELLQVCCWLLTYYYLCIILYVLHLMSSYSATGFQVF